jgi:hypothetical protein
MPKSPLRPRWSIPEWASVVGVMIAILSFLGIANYQVLFAWLFIAAPKWTKPQPPSQNPSLSDGLDQRKFPPPPPPLYRQASDVSDTAWAMDVDGCNIRVEFKQGGGVTLSDPIYGSTGHWRAIGKNSIVIETQIRTISATMTTDRQGMNAEIFFPGTMPAKLDRFNLVLRRIE